MVGLSSSKLPPRALGVGAGSSLNLGGVVIFVFVFFCLFAKKPAVSSG